MNNRLDASPTRFRRSIHVGNPGNGRSRMFYRSGNRGKDDPMRILVRFYNTHFAKFLGEHAAEFELAGRTGISRRVLVSLRVYADIPAEAFKQRVHVAKVS